MVGACGARRGSPARSARVFLFCPVVAGGSISPFRAFVDEADISLKTPLVGDAMRLLLSCGSREAGFKGKD